MQPESDRDPLLIRYVLGELSEEEQNKLEQEYFANSDLHDAILATEDEVIYAYIRGDLSTSQRIEFERLFLQTPERLARVQFARSLTEFLDSNLQRDNARQRALSKLLEKTRGELPIAAVASTTADKSVRDVPDQHLQRNNGSWLAMRVWSASPVLAWAFLLLVIGTMVIFFTYFRRPSALVQQRSLPKSERTIKTENNTSSSNTNTVVPGRYEPPEPPPPNFHAKLQNSPKLASKVVGPPSPGPAPTTPRRNLQSKLEGTVTVEVSPPIAEVRYTRTGENNYQSFRGPSMELEAGSYTFVARAQGYQDANRTIEVTVGSSQHHLLILAALVAAKTPVYIAPNTIPTTITHTMRVEDWDKPWNLEDAWYTRIGGDFNLYKVTPTAGTLTFAVSPKESKGPFGGLPKVRWIVDYVDSKNYIECEFDKQNYASAEYRNDKKIDHAKRKPHGVSGISFNIMITIDANRLLIQIRNGDKWETLDQWNEFGHNFQEGHFGFRLPNQDQMFLAQFTFVQQTGNQ